MNIVQSSIVFLLVIGCITLLYATKTSQDQDIDQNITDLPSQKSVQSADTPWIAVNYLLC
jgi:hypothetical protein